MRLLFLLTLMISSTYGQPIAGRIVDAKTREPLPGAHVLLYDNWKIFTVSDTEGSFKLENAAIGDTLIISYVGYKESMLRVSSAYLTIRLDQKAEMMQAVEVEAERLIAEDFSYEKVEKLEIYKNPAAKADALLAVNALPSATTLDESANVSFRGSSPALTGIFLNQVPIYDAVRFAQLNGIGTFSIFNTEIIDNIQVFPGNPPLEFGNTSSGLIALQTESIVPAGSFSTVTLSPASFGLMHRRSIGKKIGLSVYGNYQPSGLLRSLNPKALEDIPHFSSKDFGIHLVASLSDKTDLKVFNYFLHEGYEFNFRSPSFNGLLSQNRERMISIANLSRRINKEYVLTLNAGHSISDMDISYSVFNHQMDNQDIYASANLQREKKRSSLKTGLAYDRRNFTYQGIDPIFSFALDTMHPSRMSSAGISRELLEGYAYYKYFPSEWISFGYSMRKNIPLNGQPNWLSFQSNIMWRPSENHTIKMANGRYNSLLINQTDYSKWHVNTRQFTLDYTYNLPQWEVNGSFFTKRADFEIREENVIGVEAGVRYHNKIIDASVSYTGLDASVNENEISYSSSYDLAYFIRSSAELNIKDKWTVGMRGLFRQGSFYQPLETVSFNNNLAVYEPQFSYVDRQLRLPAYNVVDLNISRKFVIGESLFLVVFASASNVFDCYNIRDYTYNADFSNQIPLAFNRRTIYFGASLTF